MTPGGGIITMMAALLIGLLLSGALSRGFTTFIGVMLAIQVIISQFVIASLD